MGIWGSTGYYPSMVMRQFGGKQHISWLTDLSRITCEYGLQDIDIATIECAFDFWKEHKSTIDYPTCPKDDYEWSTVEFREGRAIRDPCFLTDLSVLDPFDPRLLEIGTSTRRPLMPLWRISMRWGGHTRLSLPRFKQSFHRGVRFPLPQMIGVFNRDLRLQA